jgi:hypothetical protein
LPHTPNPKEQINARGEDQREDGEGEGRQILAVLDCIYTCDNASYDGEEQEQHANADGWQLTQPLP